MALGVEGRGGGGSHMAADKERGGKADRAKGTETRGGREARTGRTTRSPSAKRKSSGDPCVFTLKRAPLTDNAADPIQHGVTRADRADATNLDGARRGGGGGGLATQEEGYGARRARRGRRPDKPMRPEFSRPAWGASLPAG